MSEPTQDLHALSPENRRVVIGMRDRYESAIRALLAFRDAIRNAPNWAYPFHNMALAFSQSRLSRAG
mgnify:CR=1 FL=1